NREATMSIDGNIQLIQKIYAAFGRGDVPAILEVLSDDVKWGVYSRSKASSNMPWHMALQGRSNVPKFFVALAENAEFTRFEPHAFVASEEHVYCTVSWDVTYKPNGKKMTHPHPMHRFTLKNGRVTEWVGTEDTAATLELVTGK